jgi:hypothetical protein
MLRVLPQLIVFSYHKSGTTLFWYVMTKVSERLGLTLVNHYGLVDHLEPEPDIVLLPHSMLRAPLDRPYRAIRLIRDPRDIWVSGYLYHLRCDEGWCINTDIDPTPPIAWPKIDHSAGHWTEDRKRHYLQWLGRKSYQQNLLDRSLADGLDFELEGYTGCTLAAMREWPLNEADALDVKLEDVMADFDGAMLAIFDHFGFTAEQTETALEVARSEDVNRMDDATVSDRLQIHSRKISKWRDVLTPAQVAHFEASHGDLIRELGYELSGATWNVPEIPQLPKTNPGRPKDAGQLTEKEATARVATSRTPVPAADSGVRLVGSRPAQSAEEHSNPPVAVKTTQDAGIRLCADGAFIRPTAASHGAYTFVVPSGRQRVRLESHHGVSVDPRARRRGVRVSEVAIRSDAGEVVIAADDPRLTTGWHDAEHAGTTWWRWTNGSAELPWTGVSGPAVVTVRCGTLAEYSIDDEELEH